MPLDFSYLNQFQRPAPVADPVEIWNKAKDANLTRKANEADFQYKRELLKDQTIQNDLKIQQQTQAAALQQQQAKDNAEHTKIFQEVYSNPDLTTNSQRNSALVTESAKRVSAPAHMKFMEEMNKIAKEMPTLTAPQLDEIKFKAGEAANLIDHIMGMSAEDRIKNLPLIQQEYAKIDPSETITPDMLDDTHLGMKKARLLHLGDEATARQKTAVAKKAEVDADVADATKQDAIDKAYADSQKAFNDMITSAPNPQGRTQSQQDEFDTKNKDAELKTKQYELDVQKANETARHNRREELKPVSDASALAALDRESARFSKPHEKIVADSNVQLDKIAEARSMINGSAEAQALGIPKILTALVSGAGTGVRITMPELQAIASARGIGGNIEGFINQISGEGKLTKEQQKQLTLILDDVKTRVEQKRGIANDALDGINTARTRDEVVRLDSEARKKYSGGSSTPTEKPKTMILNGKTFTLGADGLYH